MARRFQSQSARRRRHLIISAALSANLLLLSMPAAAAQKDVGELASGTALERELAASQAHAYRMTLTTGQYLRVWVDQRGIDVVVVLRRADGVQLMEMDGVSGLVGVEELSWEAAAGGQYTLE